ncbi:MAG: hypothetical protein IIX69_07165 [Clostridia bacterium]|nr:hypothetical protein [Clostridia bacterium]MBQ1934337.1 hypothetical protein [Clostridia bacterium]MBR0327132.1 hypothetical protein [Clostridia bacterium]
MSDIISTVEKACASARKLNFPIYKVELAAAAEITDLNNNKETFSFSCRKKIGLLWVIFGILMLVALIAAKAARHR